MKIFKSISLCVSIMLSNSIAQAEEVDLNLIDKQILDIAMNNISSFERVEDFILSAKINEKSKKVSGQDRDSESYSWLNNQSNITDINNEVLDLRLDLVNVIKDLKAFPSVSEDSLFKYSTVLQLLSLINSIDDRSDSSLISLEKKYIDKLKASGKNISKSAPYFKRELKDNEFFVLRGKNRDNVIFYILSLHNNSISRESVPIAYYLELERFRLERAEQERAEQERAEQERAEQERAEQEKIEQEKIEQEKIEQEKIEQERAENDISRLSIKW